MTARASRRAARRFPKEYRQAICPCCGRSQGQVAFWERTQEFDPDKPFGVIQEVGLGRGQGNLEVIGHFGPDKVLFPLVKARLIAAVKEWVKKGWLSAAELKGG